MSLKDLLPEGTFDEIAADAHLDAKAQAHLKDETREDGVLCVRCPNCGKKVKYSPDNPFRPFCSERCRLLDLGAWAKEERTVPGNAVNADEDADLLNDPALPRR